MAILEKELKLPPEPAWEIAKLFPDQGTWSEWDYLALDTNNLVEFTDGRIEVLSMPTILHQRIVSLLHRLLWTFIIERDLGEVLFAPLRVRLRPGKIREPDIIYLSTARSRDTDRYPNGADLVMEVVSPDDPARDYERKVFDYAEAGIPEYWIVDPQKELITVLALQGEAYAVHGEFSAGEVANSVLLEGFAANVDEVFAAGQ